MFACTRCKHVANRASDFPSDHEWGGECLRIILNPPLRHNAVCRGHVIEVSDEEQFEFVLNCSEP